MNDRELLELAAKAMHNLRDPNFMNYSVDADGVCLDLGSRRGAITAHWNPLTDDGDALRLAVKLRIDVMHDFKRGERYVCAYGFGLRPSMAPEELLGNDPCAATRRAIVRAAAALAVAKVESANV